MLYALDPAALPVPQSLWSLSQPWWEFPLRALLVYGFLLLVLRLSGKRQVSQLSPFDLVLLLLLSNAVQNSMNGGDNSVGAGFLLVGALVGVNLLVGRLSFRSKRLERLLEGKPRILVHNGLVDEAELSRACVSHHELMAAVRQAGIGSLEHVHAAILETNGRINVVRREEGGPERPDLNGSGQSR